jgi:phosphoglycerate dehydrogenase-like enzyme
MKPYRVLLYEDMHPAGKEVLAAKSDLVMASSLDEASLVEQVQDVDAIIIRANGSVTAKLDGCGSKAESSRAARCRSRRH